ncbi:MULTISPECIES: hypothetical protein [Rhodococcus]|uniref:hypothetical protein n=1 Tax=Rhodococcus TaxID=1827 RepID=UPI002953255E|nr:MULTISPECIES: hypothetical protein [Rhodococcus]MDV7246239.1 hypothetical protein [Rhodococcus oxybenzonivorans]MDV7337289.1 hypothetical protein [Rhodococcus oxybenzonivorans]MDV8030723.1 hypothetical protein [Rhodococcus sp. IEGM 27]
MTFRASLRDAMDTTDGLAYIDRVKAVVHSQLEELDSTAHIEDTKYFNHSAVPDFVMSWPGERGQRNVYLRDSYDSIVAGEDESYLAKVEPVLLALDTSAERSERLSNDHTERADAVSGRTLVTDVEAVEVIAGAESTAQSPLRRLVRANFVRGARGHIDHDRAEMLVGGPSTPDSGVDQQSLATLISNSFVEDAAARITRTAQLIELAMHATSDDLRADSSLVGGKLSLAELRHLLPWLLTQPEAIRNAAFWRYVGTLMSFDDLERIRDDLSNLDVTPLITANAANWEANWAYLGVSKPQRSDEAGLATTTDPGGQSSDYWSFDSGRLGLNIGEQRILVARNGQLIRARDNRSSASWEDLRGPLANYRLARVALHGIRRSITVDAEQSPDVRGDVEEVATSLEDRYYVTEATVRIPSEAAAEGMSSLLVDFGGSTVHTRTGASIRELATTAAQVLNYHSPQLFTQVTETLGTPRFAIETGYEDA